MIGAFFVVAIILLTKTKYSFLCGLLPLFPTFTLMSHYIVGTTHISELREVIIFGMWSMIPYFLYLMAVYYLCSRTNLYATLGIGLTVWTAAALVLVVVWHH